MNEIRLENFRCFRDRQSARLAPLTLLVGENSTGKTSFLAMIRALWDVAYRNRHPDFKREPYDLGSFRDIAHHRGGRIGRADTFSAGFTVNARSTRDRNRKPSSSWEPHKMDVFFCEYATAPAVVGLRFETENSWIDMRLGNDEHWHVILGTNRGRWRAESLELPGLEPDRDLMPTFPIILLRIGIYAHRLKDVDLVPIDSSGSPTQGDLEEIEQVLRSFRGLRLHRREPFASAPVRSKPQRTYDPSPAVQDPEGDYIPMYLADVATQKRTAWARLKIQLEGFGQMAGLFDEIHIKRLGKSGSEPFQIQIKKSVGRLKGMRRNLIDVGYGVSQVLPVITELLRSEAPSVFLLQQPEVHLHPKAQAALGSLFCEIAGRNRQIVVETHSDHLIDRVLTDIRDGRGRVKAVDVSILFFERRGLDVHVHSLKVDEEGNVMDEPDSYRDFFMQEMQRSLGL